MYPQIVPTEIYEKVKLKIQANRYGKRSLKTNYLLRHKLTCGYCGMSMCAECGTSKDGKRKFYYKCLGRKTNNGCKKSILRKEYLEELILNNLITSLSKPIFIEKLTNNLINLQNQSINNTTLSSLINEQKQTQSTLNNIMKAIEIGIFNSTTNKRMNELEEKLKDLEKQILIENNKYQIKLTSDEIKKYYKQALKLEPEMIIDYLIKNITLYEDKIEITFNTPLKISPDKNQGFFYANNIKNFNIEYYV